MRMSWLVFAVSTSIACSSAPEPQPAASAPEKPKPPWVDRGLFVGELEGKRSWFAVVSTESCGSADAQKLLTFHARAKITELNNLNQQESGSLLRSESSFDGGGAVSPVAAWHQPDSTTVFVLYRLWSPDGGLEPAAAQTASSLEAPLGRSLIEEIDACRFR